MGCKMLTLASTLLEDAGQERVCSSCFGVPWTASGLSGPALPTLMPANVPVLLAEHEVMAKSVA